jgi:hypothetical protein
MLEMRRGDKVFLPVIIRAPQRCFKSTLAKE